MTLRRHEVTRLEGFSDAVFGFALTLLVVSLEVPNSVDELLKDMQGLVGFALMFAMVCWIWYEHNVFFRRYGLQDAWTTTLNAVLLFVVLFYVYPLKFLFTAAFSFFIPLLRIEQLTVTPSQLARIFAIYGAGFVVLFAMFALLYLQAWRKRHELNLTTLERFDTRAALGAHLVSATVGVIATGVALFAPMPLPLFSGFTYFLMGPAHWVFGVSSSRRRKAIEAQIAPAGV